MSYLAAAFSVFYSNEVVLIVMGMTAVVTTIIALLATFSRVILSLYAVSLIYTSVAILHLDIFSFNMRHIETNIKMQRN